MVGWSRARGTGIGRCSWRGPRPDVRGGGMQVTADMTTFEGRRSGWSVATDWQGAKKWVDARERARQGRNGTLKTESLLKVGD